MARVVLFPTEVTKAAQHKAIPLVKLVASRTLQGAKHLAPRGDHLHGSGKPVRGQRLHESLHVKPLKVTRSSVHTRVGSPLKYATTVHQGSKRHVIRSRGKTLMFHWERRGFWLRIRRKSGTKLVFVQRVNHPGNRHPHRYLTTPMVQYGRAAGFRTISSKLGRSGLLIMLGYDY